jgi:hypothetical protein
MKDRAHHGITFMTGLALVLALFASACVAGEVGDEGETPTTTARADQPRDDARSASDPYADDEENAPDEDATEGAVPAPCLDLPHEGHDAVGSRRCELGRGTVRFDPVIAQPPKEPEPPPNPW